MLQDIEKLINISNQLIKHGRWISIDMKCKLDQSHYTVCLWSSTALVKFWIGLPFNDVIKEIQELVPEYKFEKLKHRLEKCEALI